MTEKITLLTVEPNKKPYKITIEHTLEDLQKIVGGYIQCIYPWEEPVGLVCNEDGIALKLPFNRYIDECEYGPVFGTFFLCGLGEDDFVSLTDEQIARYTKRFEKSEELIVIDGDIVVFR